MGVYTQNSYTGGILSETLGGRTDFSKYASGLAGMVNFLPRAHGVAESRAGTEFIAEVDDSSTYHRLLPFQYSMQQTYILDFGDQTMRVIKNAAQVLESNKAITGATKANPCVLTVVGHGYTTGQEVYVDDVGGMVELNGRNYTVTVIGANSFSLDGVNSSAYTTYTSGGNAARVYTLSTPYLETDLFHDPEDPTKPGLKKTQSLDTMTITHPSYEPRDLTRTGHAAWTLSTISFSPTQDFPDTLTASATTTGSETVRYQVTAYNDEEGEESLPGINTTGKSITGATQANPCVITSNAHGYVAGEEVYIELVAGMTQLNGRRFKVGGITANTFTLVDEDSTGYDAYTSGGTAYATFAKVTNSATTVKNSISWAAVDGATSYNVYRNDNGLYGFIGKTEDTSFVDDNMDPDLTDTPPKERNPFFGDDNWPGVVTYYSQRKAFAASNNKRQTLWMTQTANFRNMTYSSPRKDSDAITRTVNSDEAEDIRFMAPLRDLIVGTAGSAYKLTKGQDGVLTPTTIDLEPQEWNGCSHVEPIKIGDSLIYNEEDGSRVRDLFYKLETNGYSGNDLSILAPHLFEGYTIRQWAFAKSPMSVLWVVRSDGQLLSLTYLREQQIWGWAEHYLGGNGVAESVAVVNEGRERAVYFLVRRTIGGTTKRYIERLRSRRFDDERDAFSLDCALQLDNPMDIEAVSVGSEITITITAHGLENGDVVDISDMVAVYDHSGAQTAGMTDLNYDGYIVSDKTANTFKLKDSNGDYVDGSDFYDYVAGQGVVRKAVDTVDGLWHLEGETVYATVNGNVVADLTVTNGTVTLPNKGSRIVVGYPYNCDLETLDIPQDQSRGSAVSPGKRKKVTKVHFKVSQTRGVWVGPNEDGLKEARQGLAFIEKGTISITIQPKWNTNGRVLIRQPDPLPITILSHTLEYTNED